MNDLYSISGSSLTGTFRTFGGTLRTVYSLTVTATADGLTAGSVTVQKTIGG